MDKEQETVYKQKNKHLKFSPGEKIFSAGFLKTYLILLFFHYYILNISSVRVRHRICLPIPYEKQWMFLLHL